MEDGLPREVKMTPKKKSVTAAKITKPKKSVERESVTVVEPTALDADEHVGPEMGFPIVGIGASAGGLAAFEAFFSGMPADVDPGMAFVLVQHLSAA